MTTLTITSLGNLEPSVVEVKLVIQYGQRVTVPVSEDAKRFAQIAGTKTLTPGTIALIKELGYRVKVIPTEPSEL